MCSGGKWCAVNSIRGRGCVNGEGYGGGGEGERGSVVDQSGGYRVVLMCS